MGCVAQLQILVARADAHLRTQVPAPVPAPVAPAVGGIALTACALGVLIGVSLPWVVAPLLEYAQAAARSVISLPAYVRAALPTGTVARVATAPPLHLYLIAWAVLHMLEFVVTAYYNGTRLFADCACHARGARLDATNPAAFLLMNGVAYYAAHLLGLLEFLVEAALFPEHKQQRVVQVMGLALVVFGQVFRSLAMVHAGGNFSHTVARQKREDHVLVKHGVYAYVDNPCCMHLTYYRIVRHPSYAGFFYWALGTQLLLLNPISTIVYIITLRRFFAQRIEAEEYHLVHFFGNDYTRYRARTRSGVPLVR